MKKFVDMCLSVIRYTILISLIAMDISLLVAILFFGARHQLSFFIMCSGATFMFLSDKTD